MKSLQTLFIAAITALLVGCAHPIVISSDISKLEAPQSSAKIEKNVAYYISPENRALAVTTPGGGGDKVTYQPYRDIETGLYTVLNNVFKNVSSLPAPMDAAGLKAKQLNLLITPSIVTQSSSSSALTWPPTAFSVELTCNITDANGATVATKSVKGEGKAEFDEFKSDFPLSAKRATHDALTKLQALLLAMPELKN